ncbi:aspartyl/asparaginyl beta-hydroxylase domain-containing protein [Sphaerisporangium sp. B11E5]|uniref:aspartyl/asparaginyl beta-hydroxylase domain-containing protein n=1 Tax=Sphaerisporangium sp. B11E5 TaxID=3153563 RepID=UPI00325DD6D8
MRTRYVTTVELDEARLAKDLEQSASFHYSEAYSNYLIGGPWKSAMVWATGGDTGTGVLTNYAYDQRSTFTEYGGQLPYIQELITDVADLSRLQFVRLAVFSDSVIIPHRDFLELSDVPEEARSAHRLHIPLVTHDNCFFSEDNVVYRMRAGEIWYFDAARIHSVASLSSEPRIHLIFDFADRSGAGPLVNGEPEAEGEGIPAGRRVERPPLPDARRANLLRLADVLTMDNFREVFSIVIKTHFRWDGGENFAWDTMTGLARACEDPAVLPHTLNLQRYYTLDRSGSKE